MTEDGTDKEDARASGQAAEFDTVADWTAQAAAALGPAYHIPAACRGSGGPPALDWLLDRCRIAPTIRLIDVGAGMGGPAAYAAGRTGVRPLLIEPQPGACRAARRLFGLDVVQADALALPIPDHSCDVVWSLGVLDTVPDQAASLAEISRCLAPSGLVGLLAYVASTDIDEPDTNHFPRPDELTALMGGARLEPIDRTALAELAPVPDDWQRRADEVDREVARRHGHHPLWQQAADQERTVVRLIASGQVTGQLYLLRRSP
jgi:SAM-dependent methyltransferase